MHKQRFFKIMIFIVMMGFISVHHILLQGRELTTVILVRHAEKVTGVSIDPWLDSDGRARARELAYILEHVSLDAIYSTPFKRTIQTVMPIVTRKGVKITTYTTGNEKKFIKKILKVHSGGTVLIVGHSNTIPIMVNLFLSENKYDSLHDDIYDNLFTVTAISIGNSVVTRLRFGAHTPVAD